MKKRVFFGHPKDYEGSDALVQSLKHLLTTLGYDVEVVSGSAYFDETFQRFGGWDAWCTEIAVGTQYSTEVPGTFVPRFDLIVVGPLDRVGKATYSILDIARRGRKPCFFYDGHTLRLVVGVQQVSANFKDGWQVYATP